MIANNAVENLNQRFPKEPEFIQGESQLPATVEE